MKGSAIGVVGIIIILVVVGLVFFRSTDDEALEVDDDVVLVEGATPGAQDVTTTLTVPADGSDVVEKVVVSDAEDEPGVEATGKEVVVSLTDGAFEPATVTIAAGTAVKFVNNGQGLHWPASFVHPVHQVLPGFDSERGLSTGETYSFVFTKVGTWPMHDHLFPQVTGKVIVE